MVEPINALFREPATWSESGYQPAYEPIRAVRAGAVGGPAVEVWTVASDPGERIDARRRREGECIAEAIDREIGDQRTGYRRFAMLFRTFASIRFYLRPLRERGIPFVVDGGKEFLRRPDRAVPRHPAHLAQPATRRRSCLPAARPPAGCAIRSCRIRGADLPWDWRPRRSSQRSPPSARVFPLLAARLEGLRRCTTRSATCPPTSP